MDTLDKLPAWAAGLVDRAREGHLGLIDDADQPRVMPVTFALCDDAVWSAIDNKPKRRNTEPARLRWLRRWPRAALTVDEYAEDWSRLAWVQILGEVAIMAASARPDAVEALCLRYPQYRSDPPPGPLLRLTPERVICWRAKGRG